MENKQKKGKRKEKKRLNQKFTYSSTGLFDYFFGWAVPWFVIFILITILASFT